MHSQNIASSCLRDGGFFFFKFNLLLLFGAKYPHTLDCLTSADTIERVRALVYFFFYLSVIIITAGPGP